MKIACPRISRPPIFRICPFRIIAIASKPAKCSSGGSEPAEAEPRSDQTLDAPMILLDNIIQILALPETRTAPEFAVSLHLRDRPWIGGVLVDRERARIDGVRLRERLAEEPLRRSRIAPCSPTRSRSSARGCPPPDRDTSNVPSPGHRSRPPARSRCSSADAGGSASQVPRHRPGSNGRSLCGRPRRRGRGASVRDRGS